MTTYKLPRKFQCFYDIKCWEQTDKQLDQLVKSDNEDCRELAAYFGRGKDLDILAYDKHPWVRQQVACQGRDKDLDILVNDPNKAVRSVAKNQLKRSKLLTGLKLLK